METSPNWNAEVRRDEKGRKCAEILMGWAVFTDQRDEEPNPEFEIDVDNT